MSIVEDVQPNADMAEDLARLIRLIETSRVEEARALVTVLARRWPDSRDIQHFAHVLAPPRILPSTPGPPARSFARDHQWLREHGHEYPGYWIATLEDRLIAADPSLSRVMEIARDSVDLTREMPLLHYPPVAPE